METAHEVPSSTGRINDTSVSNDAIKFHEFNDVDHLNRTVVETVLEVFVVVPVLGRESLLFVPLQQHEYNGTNEQVEQKNDAK